MKLLNHLNDAFNAAVEHVQRTPQESRPLLPQNRPGAPTQPHRPLMSPHHRPAWAQPANQTALQAASSGDRPNPAEFGLPAGLRQKHLNSDATMSFVILDNGQRQYLKGGSFTPSIPPAPISARQESEPMPARGEAYGKNYRSGLPPFKQSWTELMLAMHDQSINAAPELVLRDYGANVHETDPGSGHNALMNAAINGKTDFIQPLLDRGVNLGATDNMGRSALHSAAAFGQSGSTQVLLWAMPANVLAQEFNRRDNAGFTPLMLAARNGKQETVAQLSQYIHLSPNPASDLTHACHLAAGKLDNVSPGRYGYHPQAYAAAQANMVLLRGLVVQHGGVDPYGPPPRR